MSSIGLSSVDAYTFELRKLLARAKFVKSNGSIEPPLLLQDFGGVIEGIENISESDITVNKQGHYAAIETASRNTFYDLLVVHHSMVT